jgi:hypothetical protein
MGNLRAKSSDVPVPPRGTQDRRVVCRYSVVLENAWLGWWEGQAFQSTPAKIIDISLRGARLNVSTFPPKDQPLWFCPLGMTSQDEWIKVKLVNAKKRLFGPREVRVSFRKLFPYDVFKTVVYGPDSFAQVEAPAWVPEDADERDWW